MNETNGPGAVVLIESRDPHDIPEGKSARWVRDDSREEGGYWAYPAAPPQESDKGRDAATWESMFRKVQTDRDQWSERAVAAEDKVTALERQLAEARAEVEALCEEVALTNEHEHQILQERNEARDLAFQRSHQIQGLRADLAEARAALLAYQKAWEAEPASWFVETANVDLRFWGRREAAEQVAEGYGLTAIPLYRHPPAPADAVTVPREWISVEDDLPEDGESVGFIIDLPRDEWDHGRAVGGRFNRGQFDKGFGGFSVPGITWAASHWCRLPPVPDALRSSAQAGKDGG